MRKTITIFKHEFRQTLRRKVFILTTLGLPLLLMLGYGIYEGVQHWSKPNAGEEIKQIGYVDHTGMFNEYTVQASTAFVLYENVDEAKSALLSDEIDEYYVIPADYVSRGVLYRYTAKRELELPSGVWNRTKDFLLSNLLAGELSDQMMERVEYPLRFDTTRLDETGNPASSQDEATVYFLPIIFGLLFIFAIFFSAGSLLDSVAEEKESRIIEILLSSVSSRQLLVGKVLGLGAAGLLQIAVWLTSLKIFTEIAAVNIPVLNELSISVSVLVLGIIYFLFGYLLFAAIYAGVGSVVPAQKEAQALSFAFAIPAMLPMMLNILIISNPEGIFARVLSFLPLTAPITSIMRLTVDAISVWEIALSLVILAFSFVFTIWFSAKIFRTHLLMYGKRPGLREIVRNARAA